MKSFKTKTIAVLNQKGGVGKTTSAVNIASFLAITETPILLIDMDPQGNATMGSGLSKYDLDYSLADLLLGSNKNVQEVICKAEEGFDLIPYNQALTFAEVKLLEFDDRELVLKNILENVKKKKDQHYLLIR